MTTKNQAIPQTQNTPTPKSGILQRQCACGQHTNGEGECEECKNKKSQLQRALHGPGPDTAPPIVYDVLASPGKPLDAGTRAFFEPRFGYDFSQVRMHTGARATESVVAMNALAYTVGSHIVLRAAEASRALMAHELTHVVQQRSVSDVPQHLPIASAYISAEQEARSMASALAAHRPRPAVSASAPLVARFEPSPGYVVPEIEMEPEVEPEAELGPRAERGPEMRGSPFGPGPTRQQQQAYAESRSFEKMYRRARRVPNSDAARDELERPVAILGRGGAAPDFVTASPQPRTIDIAGDIAGSAGNVRVQYTPHWFHVLDALEYDAARVSSSNELLDVFRAYFPESALSEGRTMAGRSNYGARIALRWGIEYNPMDLDPDGIARTPVFLAAAAKVVARDPKIKTDRLIETLIREHNLHEEEMEKRRQARLAAEDKGKSCMSREVNRKGSDHDKYAEIVTGSATDFEIVAPDGQTKCVTDGREPMNPKRVWEVKTRHEWATSYGIPGAIFAPYFSGDRPGPGGGGSPAESKGRIYRIEEQRERCLDVTRRCGYEYAYAFEDKSAADFVRALWNNTPPVFHRPR